MSPVTALDLEWLEKKICQILAYSSLRIGMELYFSGEEESGEKEGRGCVINSLRD